MEELSQNLGEILKRVQRCESKWEKEVEEIEIKLHAILFGPQPPLAATAATAVAASPQQQKKRPKRLSSVDEDETEPREPSLQSGGAVTQAKIEINETIPAEVVEESHTEPEPEHIFARPKRAAKMKTESLKEPSVQTKMRRPDNPNETAKKIKKENEQRQSQSVGKKSNKSNKSQSDSAEAAGNESLASQKKVDESVVIAEKDAPVIELFSEEESTSSNSSAVAKKKSKKNESSGKNPVVKVKKEKLSQSSVEDKEASPASSVAPKVVSVPFKLEVTSSVEDTLQITTSTDTTAPTRSKRVRKKKEFNHRPIKEERLSIVQIVESPVSTRTRSGSMTKPRPASVYEDAVDNIQQEGVEEEKVETTVPRSSPPPSTAVIPVPTAANVSDETVNNATMMTACDATFVTNQQNATFAMPAPQTTFIMEDNPNATVTIVNGVVQKPNGSLGDATFDVRDPPANDSIMTEDESFEKPLATQKKLPAPQLPPPPPPPTKVLKSKSKPHELFNPCVQSPVKKKVEAFEHHAHAASQEMRLKTRSKRTKENTEPELPTIRDLKVSGITTPVIGKLHAPVLGRFLTPTQQSNVTPTAGNAKKLPNSASKIMSFPTSKYSTASNLKCSSSASSQSLSRENSEEDLKKGFNKLQKLAEERKKKRELKHQQAAALREAKEKERADRLKKIMKEREEKNRKKALEMEQKKRELEEINRNLKLQEERELKQTTTSKTKVDAAEAARQERDLLEQMKMPRMKIPLPPKQHNKYNFNMLHSDDSTDEETKTSYKRPTPPQWSKTSVRAEGITKQAYLSSDIIDSFFSVQPMTPDLKAIFPNIDPRYLKRNSSAIWSTPPRYSEMPKF